MQVETEEYIDEEIDNYVYQYNNYIKDVVSGKKLSNKKIIQACKRHLDDLKKSKQKDYPYYFDEVWAKKYIAFIKNLTMHEGKYAGAKFHILPFQEFLVAMVCGWRKKANGLRRFREMYYQVAKKNGKTTLMAALVLAIFYMEPDARGQYVFCASSKTQAKICGDMNMEFAKLFVEQEPDAKEITEITANAVVRYDTGSQIITVARDGRKTEGKGANVVVVDEYHVHPNNKLKNSLRSGQKGRKDPLMLVCTTAGDTIGGVCHEQYEYCENVLDGNIVNDTLLIIILEADADKEWDSLEAMQQANPALGHTPELDPTLEELNEAKTKGGSTQQDYKTKTLNLWVSTASVWIPHDKWMLCYNPVDLTGLGYSGLDLAFKNDLCAYSVYYPKVKSFKTTFFIPESKLDNNEDYFDYQKQLELGNVIVAGDESLSYNYVQQYIIEHWKKDKIKAMYYDPATAHQMAEYLENENMKVLAWSQVYKNLTPVIMAIQNMVYNKEINHNGNPVFNWNMSNVLIKRNAGGYMTITKENPKKKIDGVASLFAAFACATNEAPKKVKVSARFYDENGNLIEDETSA